MLKEMNFRDPSPSTEDDDSVTPHHDDGHLPQDQDGYFESLVEDAPMSLPSVSNGEPDSWDTEVSQVGEPEPQVEANKAIGEKKERSSRNRLITLDYKELTARNIPPLEMILDPIIHEKGLIMLYADRGLGKTFLGLSMAVAVAGGSSILRWNAPRPRKVLYIDGEMQAATMQKRIKAIIKGLNTPEPDPDNFRIITPDLQDIPMPNFSRQEGQALVDPYLDDVSLLILDNLSCLSSYGRENDAESWIPMQAWLLDLRRRGMSVMFFHHTNKDGGQRGTIKKEDVVDTVIAMKKPGDYEQSEGARFEVHFEKARNLAGDQLKAFEAQLVMGSESIGWTTREIVAPKDELVKACLDKGMSYRKIEEETGIPKSTVERISKRLGAAA